MAKNEPGTSKPRTLYYSPNQRRFGMDNWNYRIYCTGLKPNTLHRMFIGEVDVTNNTRYLNNRFDVNKTHIPSDEQGKIDIVLQVAVFVLGETDEIFTAEMEQIFKQITIKSSTTSGKGRYVSIAATEWEALVRVVNDAGDSFCSAKITEKTPYTAGTIFDNSAIYLDEYFSRTMDGSEWGQGGWSSDGSASGA